MKRCVRRLALALGIGWAMGSSWTMAQEPILLPPAAHRVEPAAQEPILLNSESVTPRVQPIAQPVMPTVPPAAPAEQPVMPSVQPYPGVVTGSVVPMDGGEYIPEGRAGRRNRQGLLSVRSYGCGVDPSYIGCGTFHDELRFIFGSCRTFFGEPCMSRSLGTSRFPTVNDAAAGRANGRANGGAGGSCNCRNP